MRHIQSIIVSILLTHLVPFSAKANLSGSTYAALQNEVFVNIGEKSSINSKNRLCDALEYCFGQKMDLEDGHLNQYISGGSKTFPNNHNIQIAYYVRLWEFKQ